MIQKKASTFIWNGSQRSVAYVPVTLRVKIGETDFVSHHFFKLSLITSSPNRIRASVATQHRVRLILSEVNHKGEMACTI